MNPARDIATFGVLIRSRQRRGRRLEAELRTLDAEHAQALAALRATQERLASDEARLAAYLDRVRERTGPQRRVRVNELQAARAHSLELEARCATSRQALASAQQAVAASDDARAQARKRIVVNDNRIETLRQRRQFGVQAEARTREEREEDERDDAYGGRPRLAA